jgi:hypothetical protein
MRNCWPGCGGPGGGGPDGPEGPRPPGGGGGGGGGLGGDVPSNAALTTSIGAGPPSRTGGSTVVSRSSGGTAGRGRWAPLGARAPRRPAAFWTSSADRCWRPSLFTGRTRGFARGRGSSRPARLRGTGRTEHIRLDQMVPTAGPAYLHHVYCELVEAGRQQDQLLCCAGGTRHRAQMVSEYPRHQRQLLLTADRAHHRTGFSVELRGAQQVRIGITDL